MPSAVRSVLRVSNGSVEISKSARGRSATSGPGCRSDAGELQQPPGAIGDGQVDEFPVRQLDRVAAAGGERIDYGLRPGQLLRGRREHVVDDLKLPRVDRGLAEEAERAGKLGLPAQPRIVVEARVHAVD